MNFKKYTITEQIRDLNDLMESLEAEVPLRGPRYIMPPGVPPLSNTANARIKAEVEARWPYYQKSKEYRAYAKEIKAIEEEKQHAWLCLPKLDLRKLVRLENRAREVVARLREQFGLLNLIPPEASAEQILENDNLRLAFGAEYSTPARIRRVDRMPTERVAQKRYLEKHAKLHVALEMHASKGEIVAAMGAIIDAWQKHMRDAEILPGSKRGPDCSSFPLYALAYALDKRGLDPGGIGRALFPGEKDVDVAKKKAELYIRNGKFLIRRQFSRIIPIESSGEAISQCVGLDDDFFPRVLAPVYVNVQEAIPAKRVIKMIKILAGERLPVIVDLFRDKKEILAAVTSIIDAWQDLMRKVGGQFGRRNREPDYSLFPLYVEAYKLNKQCNSPRRIGERLFPGEDREAAEKKATLYIRNGKFLIHGQSSRISER